MVKNGREVGKNGESTSLALLREPDNYGNQEHGAVHPHVCSATGNDPALPGCRRRTNGPSAVNAHLDQALREGWPQATGMPPPPPPWLFPTPPTPSPILSPELRLGRTVRHSATSGLSPLCHRGAAAPPPTTNIIPSISCPIPASSTCNYAYHPPPQQMPRNHQTHVPRSLRLLTQ